MEVLERGVIQSVAQLERLVDVVAAAGVEIITPCEDDADMTVWYALRDTDGVERLYLGNEVTFARFVAASTGVN